MLRENILQKLHSPQPEGTELSDPQMAACSNRVTPYSSMRAVIFYLPGLLPGFCTNLETTQNQVAKCLTFNIVKS